MKIFAEVALYGSLIHVVTPAGVSAQSQKPVIEGALAEANLAPKSIEHIAPSLEDVFIASVR